MDREDKKKTLMMLSLFILLALMLASSIAHAKRTYLESAYRDQWCTEHNGRTEVTFIDGSRADCLTKDYAVEFDFANKWAEAVGQSLSYSFSTKLPPAIVLIIEKPKELRFYNKLKTQFHYIRIYIMKPIDIKNKELCNVCYNSIN